MGYLSTGERGKGPLSAHAAHIDRMPSRRAGRGEPYNLLQQSAARRPAHTHQHRTHRHAKGATHELSSRQQAGHGRARLGPVRLRVRVRRRLRGPLVVWHGHHHAHAGGAWLQGGRHLPAGLARPRKRAGPGPAAPGVSGVLRQHGLHGQPLHRGKAAPLHGLLLPRRQDGPAPRPCHRGVLQPHPACVPPRAHRAGWHRGVAQAPCPLRLLERLSQALHPARQWRRPADIRHGRAVRGRGGRRARLRPARKPGHVDPRHRVQDAKHQGRGPPARAPHLGGDAGGQAGLRVQLWHAGQKPGPVQRAHPGGGIPPQRIRGAEPADHAAHHPADGRDVRASVRADLPPHVRGRRRRPRHQGGQVLHREQPRLPGTVQLLRAQLPRGPHHPEPQPRVHPARGAPDDPGPGLQGLHQRPIGPHG